MSSEPSNEPEIHYKIKLSLLESKWHKAHAYWNIQCILKKNVTSKFNS